MSEPCKWCGNGGHVAGKECFMMKTKTSTGGGYRDVYYTPPYQSEQFQYTGQRVKTPDEEAQEKAPKPRAKRKKS